jgi:crotonobetainyl-CoA:carnitine CoA-transferase CaiB-like acyl-CoA transferase
MTGEDRLADTSPLAGIRVLDLGQSWAGPFAGMLMADLGADVIKVETATRPDILRQSLAWVDGVPDLEHSGYYIACNRGKRSVTLNLKDPAARDVLLDLVARSDVLIENFSPRVLSSLGLDREALLARNPALVVISMSGYGASGPERHFLSYGDHLMHASGFASLIGHPDDVHTKIGTFYGDPVGGLFAALRVVASLVLEPGTGVHHQLSQLEGLVALIPTALMRSSAGEAVPRTPDKSDRMSPHGFYRCLGDDTWVALAARDDADWTRLREVLRSDGTELPDLPTLAERKQAEARLDELIGAWTTTRSPWDVTWALQGAGVPAHPLHSADGLLKDDHLAARQFFQWVPRALTGPSILPGVAFRVSGDGARVRGPAPRMGEHTEQVVADLTDVSRERYEGLLAAGALR